MLHGRLKFTNAEQRAADFRSEAHRWSRRIWTPLYVMTIAGLLLASFLTHDEALLIPTGILIVSGCLLALR